MKHLVEKKNQLNSSANNVSRQGVKWLPSEVFHNDNFSCITVFNWPLRHFISELWDLDWIPFLHLCKSINQRVSVNLCWCKFEVKLFHSLFYHWSSTSFTDFCYLSFLKAVCSSLSISWRVFSNIIVFSIQPSITEELKLEGISGGHLVQTTCSSRAT